MGKQRLNFDLIILGSPASGKDTQAGLLKKKYELYPVESGKYLRKLCNSNTPEGRMLERTTGKGLPAPVGIVKKFLTKEFEKFPKYKSLLFIGNPRLVPEAIFLDKMLSKNHREYIVFFLRLSDSEVWKRTSNRLRDEVDKNVVYAKNRISYHKIEVGKTINYFRGKGKLKIINGNQSIAAVSAAIERAIRDRSKQ
jgi:adenylate kinase